MLVSLPPRSVVFGVARYVGAPVVMLLASPLILLLHPHRCCRVRLPRPASRAAPRDPGVLVAPTLPRRAVGVSDCCGSRGVVRWAEESGPRPPAVTTTQESAPITMHKEWTIHNDASALSGSTL